jgi:hypothetical protein
MNYLIYISTAIHLFNEEELKAILVQSQENNSKDGLTGMLLYGEGTFVQLLEGEADALNKTYERIKSDKRHKNLSKLDEGVTELRLFPDWSMGYKVMSPDDMSEINGYIDSSQAKEWDKREYHPALSFLKSFAEINDL